MLDMFDIYWICWMYSTYRKHTSGKMNSVDRGNAKGGVG